MTKDEGVDREERVEPAAGLVDGLADEVGGESALKDLLVFKRVVPLRSRHRPGVEPRIEDRLHPECSGPAGLARDLDVVDERTVQIKVSQVHRRAFGQLGDRTHTGVVVTARATPHRDRRAPEAIAGQRPVHVVRQPVAKPAVPDVFGMPTDLLVLGEQRVLQLRCAGEPRGLGPIDEGGAATPAVGVRVLVGGDRDEPISRPQLLDELLVRVLDENTGDRGHGVVETSLRVHRVEHRETLGLGDLTVDLTERRREMHDPGAVIDGHEVRGDDPPAVALGGEPVEGTLVAEAVEVRSAQLGNDRGPLAENRFDPCGREHEITTAVDGNPYVGNGRPHRRADVAHEGPRCGGPDQQIELGVHDGEPDVHRVFGDISVRARLAQLVTGERGSTATAIRDDLGTFVDQLLGPHLVELPPDALDEGVAHRGVGVREIEPHTDPAGHRRPVLDVALYRIPTPAVERLDAVVLDLGLAREPEFLFDLDLDGQTVAVPSGLPGDVFAPHGVEPRVNVLE